MPGLSPVDKARLLLNVGHGHEAGYVERYQRALDVVLALVEPYADPQAPAFSNTRPGSEYGRGFMDGLHAKAHQILQETVRALLNGEESER